MRALGSNTAVVAATLVLPPLGGAEEPWVFGLRTGILGFWGIGPKDQSIAGPGKIIKITCTEFIEAILFSLGGLHVGFIWARGVRFQQLIN